jgi:tRNA (cmo5U34)-methyltransferase
MSIQSVFDNSAETYDQARRNLIPGFDDFYSTTVDLIPFSANERFRVLDLGAGTGLLSLFVASSFPKATLTLLDSSEKMLEIARERFSNESDRIAFIHADYTQAGIPGKYDVILSALSIHHLADGAKQALFQRIFEALSPPGVFINADQVLGGTPEIESAYREHWLQEVHKLGVSKADLAAAFDRMQEDKMATLADQLAWLTAAGFETVNCWYKNYSFAVYSSRKT